MVSVIIPAYNVEKYIMRSIESVLKQTYTNLEIVIIDDGSTDNTGDICAVYAKNDKRIKYRYKPNEGQGIARTVGLQLAQGKYVTFLDGDDWLETEAIENMVASAETCTADVVVGDCYYVYDSGNGFEKRYSKIRYEDGMVLEKGKNPDKINRLRTFTWGKLYSREYLMSQSFAQPSYAYEDVATIPLLMAQAKRIVYTNKPVYNYIKDRADSTIHSRKKQKDMYAALKDMYRGFKSLDDFDTYETELKRMVWSQIRFMCKMSNVSYREVMTGTLEMYEELRKLVELAKELFPGFISPDECDIQIINDRYAKKAVENIVISVDNIICIVEHKDKTERIIVSYDEVTKEYVCTEAKQLEDDEDSWIWNITDEIFSAIWG